MDVNASVADATVEDGLDALSSAKHAKASWGATSPRQRADLLRAAFDIIQTRRDEIAAVITAEMGQTLAESQGEVTYGADFFRWFSEQIAHVHGDFGPAATGDYRVITTKAPVGGPRRPGVNGNAKCRNGRSNEYLRRLK